MRDRGTFNFSGNLEVKKDAPLEARSLVNSYADLVKPETWTDEQGGIWKYDCMLVSCKDRPGEVYQLQPGADYTKQSSWILIGDTSELNSKVQQFINSKGAPNGLASLNESGIIPSAQLPSYVDDVIEVDTFSNLPGTGESGKIYIVQDTNLTYRWSGTDYVEISKSLALGETSSTAYPGDKGKATTDKLNRIPDKLITDTVNVNQYATEAILNFTTYRQKAQQVGRNTLIITSATISRAGLMSSSDKTKLNKIITNGNGTKYLSDDGTYKEVSGGSSSSDINIIELQDIRDIISIVYHEKDRASSDISSVFGGSANFRSIVNDILKTHTRYFFHVKDTPDTNCIQLSGVNAWKNIDSAQYELHFIYNYYIPDGNQRTCRRVTVIDSDNTDNNLFIVENVNDTHVLSKDRNRRKMVSLVGEGFDENHWYPVSFTADPNAIVPTCNLVIWNSLNNDSAGINPKPSWAINDRGFTLHVNMSIIGTRNKLNDYDGEWGGETAVGEMRQTTQISTFYIYLRGGANYFYTSDHADLNMIAHSSEVLDGYNTYSIKDTQGDIKDFFAYVENDLFGEVKNLQQEVEDLKKQIEELKNGKQNN